MILEPNVFNPYNNKFITKILGDHIKNTCENPFELSTINHIIKHECNLSYDKLKNIFFLWVPFEGLQKNLINDQKICGIDSGMRKFLTTYSSNEVNEIGMGCNNRIRRLLLRIDKLSTFNVKKQNR
jgi:transposase